MSGDFLEEILSAKDPSAALLESDCSFIELIQKLQENNSLSKDHLNPLILSTNQRFSSLVFPILNNLIGQLIILLDERHDLAPQILESLQVYIHRKTFHSLFDKIIQVMQPTSESFLLFLCELPSDEVLDIFQSEKSRVIIFTQCSPIFHKVVFKVIHDFVSDIPLLFNFLDAIETNTEKSLFDFRMKGRQLSERRQDIRRVARTQLITYCYEKDVLYYDICTILRDMWEKTGNFYLASLRLELALDWKKDPICGLAESIFQFLSFQEVKYTPSKDFLSERQFISYDPHFIFYGYCKFLKGISDRISRENYLSFQDRGDIAKFLSILDPLSDFKTLEDFANYIEAFYIAEEIKSPDDQEFLEIQNALANIIKNSSRLAHLTLFCGEHLIEKKQNQSLMKIAIDALKSQTDTYPDLISAFTIMMHLSKSGLVEDNLGTNSRKKYKSNVYVNERIELLYQWSLDNSLIRMLFLSLLAKRKDFSDEDSDEPLIILDLFERLIDNIDKESLNQVEKKLCFLIQ